MILIMHLILNIRRNGFGYTSLDFLLKFFLNLISVDFFLILFDFMGMAQKVILISFCKI